MIKELIAISALNGFVLYFFRTERAWFHKSYCVPLVSISQGRISPVGRSLYSGVFDVFDFSAILLKVTNSGVDCLEGEQPISSPFAETATEPPSVEPSVFFMALSPRKFAWMIGHWQKLATSCSNLVHGSLSFHSQSSSQPQ